MCVRRAPRGPCGSLFLLLFLFRIHSVLMAGGVLAGGVGRGSFLPMCQTDSRASKLV
ncbi:hypothetical protein BDZ94DRAFT_1258844, partial [Collybia nuda]